MKWIRSAALAVAPPLDEWPQFDYSGLSTEDREFIEKREQAVRMVMLGKTYKQITLLTGLHHNQIRKITMMCLSRASDGRIQGFRGLPPFIRFNGNVRKAPLKAKRKHQRGGMTCMLQSTLSRFPELERRLVAQIFTDGRDAQDYARRLRPIDLHRYFTTELRALGVTELEWPFCTSYLGRRTIVGFMQELLSHNFPAAVRLRGGKDAQAHLATGSGRAPIIPFGELYDAVEIDAYHIDAIFSVEFTTPDGAGVEATLERLWLIAAVERLSTAVLAYRIVYRTEVTASDVASVIRDAICKRWVPMDLSIKGLKYPPKAGFPSAVVPESEGALWTATLLDGALAHLSNLIHDTLRKATGFVVNWGAPGHFERRPNVERTFRRIAEDLFLRLASTTGSNPRSGRAPDAAAAAIKHRIRAADIEQLVDVTFAEHNGLPGEGNYYRSPLETIRYFLCEASPATMVRRLPFFGTSRVRTLMRREIRPIRGSVKRGRRCYVQFEHVHYTSPVLKECTRLIGTEMTIYIDDEDLRTVRAFSHDGLDFGILAATGGWSISKHSLTTRKAIFSLVSKRILILSETQNPVHVYMRHLADELRKSRKGAVISPKDTTALVRVAKEADVLPTLPKGLGQPQDELQRSPPPMRNPRPLLAPPSGRHYKVKNR